MENKVKVKTSDGFFYHGDVIIGADGVHSQVRQEMARHAREIGAGEQFSEEKGRFANYLGRVTSLLIILLRCSFNILLSFWNF